MEVGAVFKNSKVIFRFYSVDKEEWELENKKEGKMKGKRK